MKCMLMQSHHNIVLSATGSTTLHATYILSSPSEFTLAKIDKIDNWFSAIFY